MKISSVLDQIDLGNYALPVFQRGYVWNRDQVRKLMTSLYKGHPIGSLLIWDTQLSDNQIIRGDQERFVSNVRLILDGQQRITSLYGIMRGKKPPFFEGDTRAFTGLYFNVETEVFEFYLPLKMNNNPLWINVTDLMQQGFGTFFASHKDLIEYIPQLNSLYNIRDIDIPIIEVTGEDKTIDIVVEIFNNVNSGGTKLSKGDLALAKLAANWPEVRDELNAILTRFSRIGYRFEMDWLLRSITVYLTSQPYFSGLTDVDILDFKKSLPKVEEMVGTILDHIGSRLGLDHNRVVKSHFAFPTIIQLIKNEGGKITNHHIWNRIMYWYIHTFLWGRYSGSTESVLAQDLNTLRNGEGIDGLINTLRKNRGNLKLHPEDFKAWGAGSRSYPLLYLLTRTYGSKDWITGIELKRSLLGRNSSLEVHHIFPKNLLYEAGFDKTEVNTLANYTFLTKDSNISISNKDPKYYLREINNNINGVLETHWIPSNTELWNIDKYLEFINERRNLLAKAANEFLDSLFNDSLYHEVEIEKNISTEPTTNEEEEMIIDLSIWMEENGLDSGELNYEVIDENENNIAIFDLAWPDGVQEGLSKPVAVLIEEPVSVLEIANNQGYTYFTNINDFKEFVQKNYL